MTPDSGAGRGATSIGMNELQPGARLGSNRSEERRLQLGDGVDDGRGARARLERRADLTEMGSLARKLRVVTDVQMAHHFDAPCKQRKHGEHRRPISQAAMT